MLSVKSAKMMEPCKETYFLWTRSVIRSPFFMRTVGSQSGTKVTPVGSATKTMSDRSEFIFRPVPCKRMKRNVWRPIRTHAGLSSSGSQESVAYCDRDGICSYYINKTLIHWQTVGSFRCGTSNTTTLGTL